MRLNFSPDIFRAQFANLLVLVAIAQIGPPGLFEEDAKKAIDGE